MEAPNSPLFPALQLTLQAAVASPSGGMIQEGDAWIPQLPDKPLAQTSSIQLYLIPAEKTLFMLGFDPEEYSDRPTLLRGCLYLRVLKSTKIKSITLVFKGQQKTDWPEGIPPKKASFAEINDLISHTWPFFQMTNPTQSVHGGADFYKEPPRSHADSEVSHLNLDSVATNALSDIDNGRSFLSRNLSPVAGFIKRTSSPTAGNDSSFTDLTTILSTPDTDASKPGHFAVGDYIYNFEHPLHLSLPETTNVTFGNVFYNLEATIVRQGAFKLNLVARMPIEIVRIPTQDNLEENEPIIISRDWEDQLKYDIVIGRKSIILDSYLPLALRFVPLYGKVALHRIRVYLTENLEYYCHNQKVHRMEPQKKYLLLEYKAEKKKSLLSDYNELGDEEVLPKELEFQLYVPSVLNDKYKHRIHPDTSYVKIQSHHWIKICLRLSRADPDNSEKRKHYEILIDTPIHILSLKAVHANTLLPAYDADFGIEQPELPTYAPVSPPMSPDVIPVDGTTNRSNSTMLRETPSFNNSSLDAMMHQIEPQFYHLNNLSDEPVQREPEMHLDANLYKPDKDHSDARLKSPQALPHPGTFNSSSMRPIHLLRKPSINPPTFEASTLSHDVDTVPPPAYEEEDHSLSMSPLRIDEHSSSSSVQRSRRRSSSQMSSPPVAYEGPVKNLLLGQLSNSRSRRRNDTEEDIADLSNTLLPPTDSLAERPISPSKHHQKLEHDSASSMNTTATDRSSSIISSLNSQSNTEVTFNGSSKSKDGRRTLWHHGTSKDKDAPNSPSLKAETEPENSSQKIASETEDESQLLKVNGDDTDLDSSRRDSVISDDFFLEAPPEQTYPLLVASTSTVGKLPTESRSSVNSLVSDRRMSQGNALSFMDITDLIGMDTGIHSISDNLSLIKNPRIKKHYQDTVLGDEPTYGSNTLSYGRRKSFGVVDRLDESDESNVTLAQEKSRRDVKTTASEDFSSPESPDKVGPIPGFNVNYSIK